ncbi:MAG: FG-GAP-like repeat-containing protein, partial [Bacteroidota bacterium]
MILRKRILASAFFLFGLSFIVTAQFNVRIVAGATNTNINTSSPFIPTGDDAELGVDLIIAALTAGDVTINVGATGSQPGNITLDVPLDFNGIGFDKVLTFVAEGSIILNENIFDSANGDLENLNVDFSGFDGGISGNAIFSNGGDISLTTSGSDISFSAIESASIGGSGGDISIQCRDLLVTGTGPNSSGATQAGNISLTLSGRLSSSVSVIEMSATGQTAGDLFLEADQITEPLIMNFGATNGEGADIDFTVLGSSNVLINTLNVSRTQGSGTISFDVQGSLTIVGNADMSAADANGVSFTIEASGNISVEDVFTTSTNDGGGDITLLSTGGDISAFNLFCSGSSRSGNLSINAPGLISLGSVVAEGGVGSVGITSITNDLAIDDISTNSATAGGGNIALSSAGLITINSIDAIGSLPGGIVSLTADEMNFNGSVNSISSNGGSLFLAPSTQSLSVGIGGTADLGGRLDLTEADLLAIEQASFNQVTVGFGNGTGLITLESNLTIGCNWIIRSPTGGSFDANSSLLYSIDAGDNTLLLDFGGDILFADLTSNGGNITLTGAEITAYTATTIDMVASGGSPLDAGTFTVNSTGSVTTNAISTGNSTPSGLSGNITIVTNADIFINGDLNTDNNSGSGDAGSVTLLSSAGAISSSATIVSSSADGNGGPVTLSAVNGDVSFGNISLSGLTGSGALTVNASTGISLASIVTGGALVDLNATGGGISTGLINTSDAGAGDITINSSGNVNTGSLTASAQDGGDLFIDAEDIFIAGPIDLSGSTSDAGSITLNGNDITITGAVTSSSNFQGGDININARNQLGAGGSNFSFISQATVNGSGGNFVLDAQVLLDSIGLNLTGVDQSGTANITTASGDINFTFFNASSNGASLIVSSAADIGINSDVLVEAGGVGAGGLVDLKATNGSIRFANGSGILASGPDQGGDVDLLAGGDIVVGPIEASTTNTSAVPGTVDITSTGGSASFSYIDLESDSGEGGTLNISAFRNVVGSSSFLSPANGETVSISAVGSTSNGFVNISHNEGVPTDFEIGIGSIPSNGLFGDLAVDLDADSENFLETTIFGGNFTSTDGRVVIQNAQGVNTSDSTALVDLYNSTNGPSWFVNTNWLSGQVENWFGVSVTDGRVTAIVLNDNNLNGSLPSSIGNLDSLKTLELALNSLSGTIPTSITNLTVLERIELWSNNLSGDLPPELGQLSSLVSLDLNGNQFTGSIPPELGDLTNLQNLSIPANQLTGELPAELGNLSNLTNIWFDNNQLSGEIPTTFNNLTNLFTMSLAGNSLSGEIPDLSNVTGLIEINLWENNLSGTIPGWIGNNTNLQVLRLYSNQLDGAVPSNWVQLTTLFDLNIRKNNLTDLPDLSSLTQLSFFDVSFNRFEADDLAPNLGVITNNDGQIAPVLLADSLILVDLYNTLGGTSWTGADTWLTNALVATWEGVGVSSGRVIRLDLAGFNVSGDLPAIIGDLDALEVFGAANNRITGVPSEIGNLTNLTSLFLDGNQIQGEVPPEIGSLTNLEALYIQNNQFTGPFPSTFASLVNLQEFWISDNQLTGEIPTFLGDFSNLRTLNLDRNDFQGPIPTSIGLLSGLQEIYLAGNALSGSIPDFSATQVGNTFNINSNRFSMEELIAFNIDAGAVLDSYNDQEFIYTTSNSAITPGNGPVTIAITNSVDAGNAFQWYRDDVALPGETGIALTIPAFTADDEGIYSCVITNSIYPGLTFRSESHSLSIDEVQRRYATSVISFSDERSPAAGAAIDALGFPNCILDSTVTVSSRAWNVFDPFTNFDSHFIELAFDDPQPINTIWVYSANSVIDSVFVKNPNTNQFEAISVVDIVVTTLGGNFFSEIEINFPTTDFSVPEVRLAMTTNDYLDAVAIGDNGIEINTPIDLGLSERVSETIFNLFWNYFNPTDSTNFIVERSTDGTVFSEVANVDEGFTRLSDRNVPVADTIFYRVKALEGSLESPFSETLVIPNCGGAVTAAISEGSWTGTAVEMPALFDPDGGLNTNISFTRNADGTIAISDFHAGYLEDSFNAIPVIGTLSEDCLGNLQVSAPQPSPCNFNAPVNFSLVEFFPASDSLVIEYPFDCGATVIRLTYTKNDVEPVPDPPQNVEASIASGSTVRLTWTDFIIFKDEWVIERSVGDNTNFIEIATSLPDPQLEQATGGLEFEFYYDNTVSAGTTYFYRIRARSASGDSEPSNEVSVTPINPIFTELTTGDLVSDQPSNSYTGAWGDYDSDGDQDLYITNWHINFDPSVVTKENYLYQNSGGILTRVSAGNALTDIEFTSRGAVWGDFNNDSNVDVFVLGAGASQFIDDAANSYLFLGDGVGQFTTISDFPSLGGITATASDFNADGNLDLILNDQDFIREGVGDGTFIARGDRSGGASVSNGAFGSFWAALTPNINNDSLPDLFLTSGTEIRLYENLGDFQFDEIYSRVLTSDGTQGRARGAVFGDFDHNGFMDIVIADVQSSILLLLDETGVFAERTDFQFLGEEITAERGLTVLDYDNDGNEDLAWMLQGGIPQLFRGNGDGTFSRVPNSEQLFPSSSIFSSLSVADYNNDGFQDLFLAEVDASRKNTLFTNTGNANNHLRINLKGKDSNNSGLDSRIRIKHGGDWYLKQVASVNGLWSANELTAHFGLGSNTVVDSLEVNWPSGVVTYLTNVAANQTIQVFEQLAPVVTIDTIITNVRSPELTGTVSDDEAVVTVELDKDSYIATVEIGGAWRLPAGRIDPPLEDGVYDVVVNATNEVGDSTDLTIDELRIDATPPSVFADNIGTSITSPEFTGFIDDFSAILTVNIEGRGDFTPTINTADSTWSIAQGEVSPGFSEADNPIAIVATAEDSLANIAIDSGELVIANSILALDASRVTTNSFRANWSAVVDAQNYTLEIATDEAFSEIVATVDTLATSFRFEDADFERDYFYRVTFDNGVDDPTTSETVSLKTKISPETVADFDALLEIEQETNATTNWDLGLRKQLWEDIVITNERVTAINLPGNTLESSFPLKRRLTSLTSIDISNNALQEIDSLGKLRSIESLNVSGNFFDFGDLEPLRGISSFVYDNQKTTLQFNEFFDEVTGGAREKADGDTLKILVFNDTTLTLSTNGLFDRYEWFQGLTALESGGDYTIAEDSLTIRSLDFEKMGKFSAQVKNDSLPDLTIPVDSMFVLAIAPFTVNVLGTDSMSIPDLIDGYLLLTEQRGSGFDTLSRALGRQSPFTIDSVILGDYLVSVDADREKYIPTYFPNVFEWLEADTIQFRNDDTVSLSITVIPPPPVPTEVGRLSVVIEEDFGDDTDARIDARRRAKKRKCGLRRRRTGGRIEQTDLSDFELFAYGETDDNGQFQFGFLPEGEYRFFVEYPGIPLDPEADVKFTVGEFGISDTEFALSAFTTPNGIEIDLSRVLGVVFEYFKDLKVYPNPA